MILLKDIELSAEERWVLYFLANADFPWSAPELSLLRGKLHYESTAQLLSSMVRKRLVIGTLGDKRPVMAFKHNGYCAITRCKKKHFSRGLCEHHYNTIIGCRTRRRQIETSYYGLTRTGLVVANLHGIANQTTLPYWETTTKTLQPTGVT